MGPVTGPLPRAAAADLEPFAGCEQLRQWYVDAALPHVGPWGLGGEGGVLPAVDADRATAELAAGDVAPQRAVGSGPTGTNVQEAGVDEPDLAKTDGSLLAHVEGPRLVLTDVAGTEPRELSTLRLPGGLGVPELLLAGDRVVVLGTEGGGWFGPVFVDGRGPGFPAPGAAATRVVVVDVTDPAAPRVEHDTTVDGRLVSARQYDDVVRLVVSKQAPDIDFVRPGRGRSRAEARWENRRLVRESSVDAWLPQAESGGSSTRLVDCTAVHHPPQASGYGTVAVVAFDPADPADRRTTAVTSSSDLVYSSSDRLYLATWQRRGSAVHAFALRGTDTVYVASGRVPGYVRDRWSFSEYDGHLRVATTLRASDPGRSARDPDENAVVVLRERGSDLVQVGRVAAMGIDEQIQSVRWFDELAVVVTFRQVDPLYTVDLSDPTAPRVIGELKIPGFSSYLHPVGGDLLLGLGQDADRAGVTRGAQAAVFDLRDLADPRRRDTAGFGRDTQLVASWDPRAFTYLPESRTVLTVLSSWRDGRTRLVVLGVAEDGTLTERSGRVVGGWDGSRVRTLPLPAGRVAVVTDDGVWLFTP